MFLLRLFGSKKLIAAVAGVLASVLVPVLNAKLGLHLDDVQVAGSIGGVVSVVLAFIAAQWHIDIATNGDTTTASVLKRVADGQVGPVPPSVVAALRVAVALVPPGPGKDAVVAALAEVE